MSDRAEIQARIAEAVQSAKEKADAEMLRVKACEAIAEGDEGWEKLRHVCPSTEAVAALRDQLQSATERLPCGHWKGDWVVIQGTPTNLMAGRGQDVGHCRTCAEVLAARLEETKLMEECFIKCLHRKIPAMSFNDCDGIAAGLEAWTESSLVERTAAAMAAQREADAITARHYFDCVEEVVGFVERGLPHEGAEIDDAIRNAPLAYAPEQKWLEGHDARVIFNLDSVQKVIDKAVTSQLAVARAETYRDCAKHMRAYHQDMYAQDFEAMAQGAEAEMRAREP